MDELIKGLIASSTNNKGLERGTTCAFKKAYLKDEALESLLTNKYLEYTVDHDSTNIIITRV